MTTDSVPVVIAYLRGQLDACHEAIAAIWNASQDQTQTELQKAATLDQAIYLATTLLPDDMRPDLHGRLSGTTYWHHPESDSYFMLQDGDLHPAYRGDADGALCHEITKEQYEAVTKPAADFEDLLG